MKHIVLTLEQKDELIELKNSFSGVFKPYSNFEPTEIKNNLWIVAEEVLSNPNLKEFFDYATERMVFDKYVREVAKEELIEKDGTQLS